MGGMNICGILRKRSFYKRQTKLWDETKESVMLLMLFQLLLLLSTIILSSSLYEPPWMTTSKRNTKSLG